MSMKRIFTLLILICIMVNAGKVLAISDEPVIKIGPNPASSFVNIEVDETYVSGIVEIYNLIGVRLKTVENIDFDTTIDISDLPTGSYIIMISNGVNKTSKRIIVQ